jgi:hypothetical protein
MMRVVERQARSPKVSAECKRLNLLVGLCLTNLYWTSTNHEPRARWPRIVYRSTA